MYNKDNKKNKLYNPWEIPFLNTLILLCSGVTVTWAHHAIQAGDREGVILGLIFTVFLGAIFTGFQVFLLTLVHNERLNKIFLHYL